jgi:hypothetical protein
MVDKSTRRRAFRIGGAAAAVLALAVAAIQAAPAQAAPAPDGRGGFTLPAGTPNPGAGFVVKSAYKVVFGVQIYSCVTAADGTSTWSTPASVPQAGLRQYGGRGRIHHFEGPRWQARDGSTIVGAVKERVAKDGTIPWLLLDVTAHENSAPGKELDNVTHISRVNTSGGVGPTGACTPGRKKAVPYGADYVFWAPV